MTSHRGAWALGLAVAALPASWASAAVLWIFSFAVGLVFLASSFLLATKAIRRPTNPTDRRLAWLGVGCAVVSLLGIVLFYGPVFFFGSAEIGEPPPNVPACGDPGVTGDCINADGSPSGG